MLLLRTEPSVVNFFLFWWNITQKRSDMLLSNGVKRLHRKEKIQGQDSIHGNGLAIPFSDLWSIFVFVSFLIVMHLLSFYMMCVTSVACILVSTPLPLLGVFGKNFLPEPQKICSSISFFLSTSFRLFLFVC